MDSNPDAPDKGMNKTLLLQGAILGGIVISLIIASYIGLI